MTTEYHIEEISFEDPSQKSKTLYTTKINKITNGRKVYAEEETGMMFHEFPQFVSSKFTPPDKRDYMYVPIYPDQETCLDFEKSIAKYNEIFENQRERVFDKYNKLYTYMNPIKEVRDDDIEFDIDPNKPKIQKFKKVKVKLSTCWSYYLLETNERLDQKNTQIVRKTISDALSKNKDKSIIDTLSYQLVFTDLNGVSVKKLVKMSEIESRKEIDTKFFYRKPENIPENAKKVSECTEEELETYYGTPELQDVRTDTDVDQFYRPGCWIRILFVPAKLWANKVKDATGKRNCSIQFVAKSIDIIHVRNYSAQTVVKTQYTKYSFGKKNNTISDSINSDKSVTKSENVVSTKNSNKVTNNSDNDDKSDEEESEEEESEEENSDEESDEESEESIKRVKKTVKTNRSSSSK